MICFNAHYMFEFATLNSFSVKQIEYFRQGKPTKEEVMGRNNNNTHY